MTPEQIVTFWVDDVGPDGWYIQDTILDNKIKEKFMSSWDALLENTFEDWLEYPLGALAYLILADQFPRNMFRESKKAFGSDDLAIFAAKSSIKKGWDLQVEEPERQFFYLPLMHAENLQDQDLCVELMSQRMKISGEKNLIHARTHREVISLFGRFPHRNEALGRPFVEKERDYLEQGGYQMTLKSFEKV